MSQDVLIASLSSEYFHFDRSYFLLLMAACWLRTCSDLSQRELENSTLVITSCKFRLDTILSVSASALVYEEASVNALAEIGKSCVRVQKDRNREMVRLINFTVNTRGGMHRKSSCHFPRRKFFEWQSANNDLPYWKWEGRRKQFTWEWILLKIGQGKIMQRMSVY